MTENFGGRTEINREARRSGPHADRAPGPGPAQKARKLSGGQRAQLALTLGIAKRPELLILDEPVASLDPLARREFLQGYETAIFLGLAGLLAAFSFWWLRRRVT